MNLVTHKAAARLELFSGKSKKKLGCKKSFIGLHLEIKKGKEFD
jgi:hypothetical protein